MSAQLTVAISTYGARIASLGQMDLPRLPHITYLVLWQNPGDLPPALAPLIARADVTLRPLPNQTGVAHSRNEAIATATTPFLIFADDDQGVTPTGWTQLLTLFNARNDLDFLCLRLRTPQGHWRKSYGPERPNAVRYWNCLKVGTPELALRLKSVRAAKLTFDPTFGAGASHPIGDEAVFICDALGAGLHGGHAPIDVGIHPADSSGMAFDNAANTTRIAVLKRCFGAMAPPLRLAFAMKNMRRFPSPLSLLAFIMGRSHTR